MRRAPVAVLLVLAAGWASAAAGGSDAQVIAFDRGGAVWTIRADGTGARKLIPRAYAPAWSRDGSRVAFVSARSGDEELYTANADGSGVRRLTRRSGPDLTPAWSPDGRRIAWTRDREIWTMDSDGRNERVLVRRAEPWHEHWSPTWHAGTIVYSSIRVSAFNSELYAVPARRLTFTKGSDGVLGDDGMPAFSPDGRRIAFVSNRDQDNQIYVMNADGSGQRRLTRRPGNDFAPAWSPDGRRIAFHRVGDGIWVMNADGSGLTRLTAGADPSWRP